MDIREVSNELTSFAIRNYPVNVISAQADADFIKAYENNSACYDAILMTGTDEMFGVHIDTRRNPVRCYVHKVPNGSFVKSFSISGGVYIIGKFIVCDPRYEMVSQFGGPENIKHIWFSGRWLDSHFNLDDETRIAWVRGILNHLGSLESMNQTDWNLIDQATSLINDIGMVRRFVK